jgi:hypothetical protein
MAIRRLSSPCPVVAALSHDDLMLAALRTAAMCARRAHVAGFWHISDPDGACWSEAGQLLAKLPQPVGGRVVAGGR